MAGFRSEKIENEYSEFRRKNYRDDLSPFVFDWENEAMETFEHWALLPVSFHYDLIADEHHLLVPKRHFGSFSEMNLDEFTELKTIKEKIGDRYSFVLENFPSRLSVPAHFHLHFIKAKDKIVCDDCLPVLDLTGVVK